MSRRTAALLVLALAAPAAAAAQYAPGTRSTSMAGAGMIYATGIDAAEQNPANLGTAEGWEVSLLELGGSGLFTGTTLGDFVDIVGAGGTGDPALVQRLPDAGFALETSSDGFFIATAAKATDKPGPGSPYPSFGVAYGPFALKVRSRLLTTGSVSKEVADLLVNGFEEERLQDYAVKNTGFRVASFSEVSLAYGYRLGLFGFGAAARRIQGHKLSQIRLFEPEIDLNAQSFTLTGVAVESPGGSGWALDLGMTLDLGPDLRWSLAMQNAFQRMSWNEDLTAHEATFTDADFDSADVDDILGRFTPSPLDPSAVSLAVYEASRGLFDEAFFPTIVRAGVGWEAATGTRVELVGTADAPRGRQRSVWDDRISLGVEQTLPVVTLRLGYARGEDGLRALAGGLALALGPVDLEAGVGTISGTGADGAVHDGLHGSLGLSVRMAGS